MVGGGSAVGPGIGSFPRFPFLLSHHFNHHHEHSPPTDPGLSIDKSSSIIRQLFFSKRSRYYYPLFFVIYELDEGLPQNAPVPVQDDSESFIMYSSRRSACEADQTRSALELQERGGVGTDGSVKHT